MADELTPPSTATATVPATTSAPTPAVTGVPTPATELEVQDRLASLLPGLAAFDAELQSLHDRLPAPPAADADAMEEDERPESLAHSLRTAIECARADWLPPLRAALEGATTIGQADLDREWEHRRRVPVAEAG